MCGEGLGLLGPQKQHRIHSRRLSTRKHQIYRRETITAANLLYTITSNKHSDSLRTLSSCSSSRSRFITDMMACPPTFTATTSKHHRTDMTASEPELSSRLHGRPALSSSFSEDASTLSQTHVGIESTAAFTGCRSQQPHNQRQEQDYGCLPLPPVVLRMHMPGSPLSPFPPQNEFELESVYGSQQAATRSGIFFSGTRAMGAGGRSAACGGRGDNPVPSEGANTNGDDDGAEGSESEAGKSVPSAYTFRRRNAIVEGSEEAPNYEDFPKSG
ncbi:hypothetical protein BGX27_009045 [Mortierella sp. AM989]|nr:hypothetical protein BGX27_009045 [Mortierella sp. AM989]